MAPVDLKKEKRVILFSDMHNYSILTRFLGAEFPSFLQEIYEQLGEIIVNHQGEIVKYIGDSIFALFPEDSEIKAVECAVKLRKKFDEILIRFNVAQKSELEIGIGSGEVYTGTFGHASLLTRDAFGPTICETAMIMHTRGIGILKDVYTKVKNSYKTKRMNDRKVKWQSAPIPVWKIIE